MAGELELSRRAAELRRGELRALKVRRTLTLPARAARWPIAGLKALTRMRFAGWSYRSWLVPGSARRFHREVGDGSGNSIVQAALGWIARNFQSAPPALWAVAADGEETLERAHPLIALLRRPNQFYAGRQLWHATLTDYHISGDSYWLKIRDFGGRVAELWWVPSTLMEPKGTTDVFITHYDYTPGGTADPARIPPSEVVHFRNGLDPDNPRKGRSPLRAVLAEVFTDEEASVYTATLLRNLGVPGVIVAPKDSAAEISAGDVEATKQYLRTQFTGDNRGEPLVMAGPTEVTTFGFSPEQMNLRDLRQVPEERITGVLGVPAIVAGMGAGLARSTFANFAEAREAAYEERIIPDQEALGEEITFQLLPDFEPTAEAFRFGFDLGKVRVLMEDENALAERLGALYSGGAIMRSELRGRLGFETTEDDDVYVVAINVVLTPRDAAGAGALQDELDAEQQAAEAAANEPPPVPPPANGNGNGGGADAAGVVAQIVGAGA